MDTVFFVLAFVVIVLGVVAYRRDPTLPLMGVESGFRTLIAILPVLVVSFMLSGLIRILIPDEVIANWFSAGSGLRGIIIASGAGMLTPGGPFVCFPIALMVTKSGAGIGPIVSYIAGWATIGLFRIPFKVSILGLKFAIIRFVCMIFLAPLAGYIAHLLFGKLTLS